MKTAPPTEIKTADLHKSITIQYLSPSHFKALDAILVKRHYMAENMLMNKTLLWVVSRTHTVYHYTALQSLDSKSKLETNSGSQPQLSQSQKQKVIHKEMISH